MRTFLQRSDIRGLWDKRIRVDTPYRSRSSAVSSALPTCSEAQMWLSVSSPIDITQGTDPSRPPSERPLVSGTKI